MAPGNRAVTMDAAQRNEIFGWMIGRTGIVPNELFIAATLLLLCLCIERRTVLGRVLKAVGSGELAAAAGIDVGRFKSLAFAISGALAAVAGLLFSVKLSGRAPTIANGFLLPAIVAVPVDGTPLTGGVGACSTPPSARSSSPSSAPPCSTSGWRRPSSRCSSASCSSSPSLSPSTAPRSRVRS